jgi:xanthine dehydrogenase YagS FAD-binding subunit
MDTRFPECNKRAPGSGCGALKGFNRNHAILGTSEQCIATHPSDMCVALAALEAMIRVRGAKGERNISMADFHRLPGNTPNIETSLEPGELILSIDLPPSPYAQHSHYLKVRDRASYEFALVSVAAALDIQNGLIHSARVAMGGVAHKPWRVVKAEQLLAGNKPSAEVFTRTAKAILAGARAYQNNAFKISLAEKAIVQSLSQAAGMA